MTPGAQGIPDPVTDGFQVVYLADAAKGVAWYLKYRSAETGPYKWYYVGGSEMFDEILTFETTGNNTYVDLATVGPTVTVPLAGDYDALYGCAARNTSSGGGAHMSILRGATAADDASRLDNDVAGASLFVPAARARRFLGLSSGDWIRAKYRCFAGTAGFENRFVSVTPVRVG